MKFILIALNLCFVGMTTSSVSDKNIFASDKNVYLNILMGDLQNLFWADDEMPCLAQLIRIMKNVQNSTLWATWIWDSMQTPVGHLYGSRNNYGNYDECVEFPWEMVNPELRTQYCLAQIHLSEVDFQDGDVDLFGPVRNYIRTQTKHHLKFNTLTWGICSPSICKPQSIMKFVKVLFRHSHLGLAVDEPQISINNCDVAGVKERLGFGFYCTWCVYLLLISFTIICSLYWKSDGPEKKSGDIIITRIFHIPTNARSLVNITDDDIRSMFGIRVISFCIIIIIHVWMLPKAMGVSNGVRLDKDLDELNLITILNFETAVDTFLFMSGFCLIKCLMRNGLKPFNPFKIIVKRYFRLAGVMLMFLLIMLNAFPLPNGPTKRTFYDKEMAACTKNWWNTVLMVQNYVDTENMCYPLLWSVPCDFHLSVLGILMFWVFAKKRKAGLLVFFASFIASIAMPAMYVYQNNEPALIHGDFRLTDNYRKYLTSNPMYVATHFRAGSYLIGLAVGYVMSIYNPATHRNILSKNKSILTFCVLMALFVAFFVTGNTMIARKSNAFEAALYASLKRIVWSGLIGVLIIVCEYGTLPLVTSFLSWSAMAPLSRLSYGIYLVHPGLILIPAISSRNPIQYDLYGLFLTASGVIVISSISSFLLYIFVEAPIQNTVSLLLKNKQHFPSQEKNDIKYTEE